MKIGEEEKSGILMVMSIDNVDSEFYVVGLWRREN